MPAKVSSRVSSLMSVFKASPVAEQHRAVPAHNPHGWLFLRPRAVRQAVVVCLLR
jgi:hypothetical protein